jgi:hypothetical protein
MFHPDLTSKQSANLYDIYLLLCVQCYVPDDGQRNCPKYIEFYSENKFENLVHLVGFIIITYVLPYFSIDNVHLMYKVAVIFCIDNAHVIYTKNHCY